MLNCIVFYCVELYSNELYYIVLNCVVLCWWLCLCCVVLCYVVLCCPRSKRQKDTSCIYAYPCAYASRAFWQTWLTYSQGLGEQSKERKSGTSCLLSAQPFCICFLC